MNTVIFVLGAIGFVIFMTAALLVMKDMKRPEVKSANEVQKKFYGLALVGWLFIAGAILLGWSQE